MKPPNPKPFITKNHKWFTSLCRCSITITVLMSAGCLQRVNIAPDFSKRQPQTVAVIPFDSAVLVPEDVPSAAAEMTQELLVRKGYRVVKQETIALALKNAKITDPGQIHCCLEKLGKELGVNAFLIGRIESFGRIGSSSKFWQAIRNMAVPTVQYKEQGQQKEKRYLSVKVNIQLIEPNRPKEVLWQAESSQWVDTVALPATKTENEALYRDLFFAITNVLNYLPNR